MKDIEIELKHNSLAEAESLAKEIGCDLEVYYKYEGGYVDKYMDGGVSILVFLKVPKGNVGKINDLK